MIFYKNAVSKINKDTRSDSDEYYVVSLCNKVLGKATLQQYKFDFLLGDSVRKLPVDVYYKELNLVVEYREYQHTGSVPLFDDRITVSGVTRGVQRQIYDQRRRELLPKYGITLIEFHYSDFGTTKKLKRNYESDIEVIKDKLNKYIK